MLSDRLFLGNLISKIVMIMYVIAQIIARVVFFRSFYVSLIIFSVFSSLSLFPPLVITEIDQLFYLKNVGILSLS